MPILGIARKRGWWIARPCRISRARHPRIGAPAAESRRPAREPGHRRQHRARRLAGRDQVAQPVLDEDAVVRLLAVGKQRGEGQQPQRHGGGCAATASAPQHPPAACGPPACRRTRPVLDQLGQHRDRLVPLAGGVQRHRQMVVAWPDRSRRIGRPPGRSRITATWRVALAWPESSPACRPICGLGASRIGFAGESAARADRCAAGRSRPGCSVRPGRSAAGQASPSGPARRHQADGSVARTRTVPAWPRYRPDAGRSSPSAAGLRRPAARRRSAPSR